MAKDAKRNLQQYADMFKALSNPNRLDLFLRLASRYVPGTSCGTGEQMRACVGDLSKEINIAPSTVSHHMKELRQAGLIHMERHGQNMECWANRENMKRLAQFFADPTCETK